MWRRYVAVKEYNSSHFASRCSMIVFLYNRRSFYSTLLLQYELFSYKTHVLVAELQ